MKLFTSWVCLVGSVVPLSALAAGPLCNEPNVLVVFDVSGSMGVASSPTSKYTQATTALVGSTTALDDEIRFGLLMFPEPAGTGCDLDATPQIGFALNNGPVFDDLLLPGGATFWGGPTASHDTPMFQALSAASALSTLQTADRRGYVLLITDGSQDCCISGDYDSEPDCVAGSTTLEATEAAENVADITGVITAMANKGIRTFVVGFGTKVNALGLNKMAVAGTTAIPGCNPAQTDGAAVDNCYYNAANGTGLTSALTAVTKVVTEESCDGQDNDCDGTVDEDFPSLGQSCDGPDVDTCASGEVVCGAGGLSTTCVETGVGIVELCDGQDNDCDGKTDEGFADLGVACDGSDPDKCAEGFIVCSFSGKSTECDEAASTSHVEACNTIDDDCDGSIDEGSDDELCGANMRCANGVCVGTETDLPGDLDDPDAGPTEPDAEDNPAVTEDTSSTDQPGNGDTSSTDQPSSDVGAGSDDVGISVPSEDVGVDVGGSGAPIGVKVPAATDDAGCGCRTLSGTRPLPLGGALGLLLVALGLLRLRHR